MQPHQALDKFVWQRTEATIFCTVGMNHRLLWMVSVVKSEWAFCGKDPPWRTQTEVRPILLHLKASIGPNYNLQCSNSAELALSTLPLKLFALHSHTVFVFNLFLKLCSALAVNPFSKRLNIKFHFAVGFVSNFIKFFNLNQFLAIKWAKVNNVTSADILKILAGKRRTHLPNKEINARINTTQNKQALSQRTQHSKRIISHMSNPDKPKTLATSSPPIRKFNLEEAAPNELIFRYEQTGQFARNLATALDNADIGPFTMETVIIQGAIRTLVCTVKEIDLRTIFDDEELITTWYKTTTKELQNDLLNRQLILLNVPAIYDERQLRATLNYYFQPEKVQITPAQSKSRTKAKITFRHQDDATHQLKRKIFTFPNKEIGFFTKTTQSASTTLIASKIPAGTTEMAFWAQLCKNPMIDHVVSLTIPQSRGKCQIAYVNVDPSLLDKVNSLKLTLPQQYHWGKPSDLKCRRCGTTTFIHHPSCIKATKPSQVNSHPPELNENNNEKQQH